MDDRLRPRLPIAIRPIRRTDATGLADFYARLMPESRRCRFLGSSMPSTDLVSALAREPGMVAVLGERGARDGEIVAHASVQLDGHHGAEVAFAVADELQGHGLGRRLVSRSLRLARELGADRASATLLAGNVPMRHLLTALGPVCADCLEAGTEEIVLDLRLPA
jgi:GNAT superfamily N-acetyltransferase